MNKNNKNQLKIKTSYLFRAITWSDDIDFEYPGVESLENRNNWCNNPVSNLDANTGLGTRSFLAVVHDACTSTRSLLVIGYLYCDFEYHTIRHITSFIIPSLLPIATAGGSRIQICLLDPSLTLEA